MAYLRRVHGFTLVELLVALFAMALLAVMSWRGLDGMTRAQAATAARADEVLTLQVGLAQWSADLDAIVDMAPAPALNWNGRVLRLTRRDTVNPASGVLVVAGVYGFGQLFESFFLTPRMVGERVGLHPLVVIFALLAFGQLFGFLGVLIALPASAVLLVAIRRVKAGYMLSKLYSG